MFLFPFGLPYITPAQLSLHFNPSLHRSLNLLSFLDYLNSIPSPSPHSSLSLLQA